MASLLLAIIYIAFISLGLPDSLLGSAWPVMRIQLDAPLSYAGIVTMIIAGGTILSSLLSDRLTKRLGTGLVTAVSVLLTAAGLFGFSCSRSFAVLCLWAVPYGLGAGAIDAALNNFVALHYSSRHMNWLHCFWGVGASVSPYIMSLALTVKNSWSSGYLWVGIIQAVLAVMLFAALPLWKKKALAGQAVPSDKSPASPSTHSASLPQLFKIHGVPQMLAAFFCYCALETTSGLWASSYLVQYRGVDTATAAMFASFIFLGISAGRFLSGFVSDKLGDRRLIFIGISVLIAGTVMVGLPLKTNAVALLGLIVIGLGGAPVYPAIIHSTPYNFGRENSQAVIGLQMAGAYTGSTLMPPLFGLLAQYLSIGFYPLFLLVFAVAVLCFSAWLNRIVDSEKAKEN